MFKCVRMCSELGRMPTCLELGEQEQCGVERQAGTWSLSPRQPEDASVYYELRSRWGCLSRGVSWSDLCLNELL